MSKDKDKIPNLLDIPKDWETHWQGMPAFNQENQMPFKSILVHFKDREDMNEFSELVNQIVNKKTQSIWYPKAKIGRISNKIYVTNGYKKNKT